MFTKISTNLGNKHEMATLIMLLIGRHKTANLYHFKSYHTIVESICEYFIFYNKQRKRFHLFHIYINNKKYPIITESIFKCFIFYNKQRKRKSRITKFKYFIIVSNYTAENINFRLRFRAATHSLKSPA